MLRIDHDPLYTCPTT